MKRLIVALGIALTMGGTVRAQGQAPDKIFSRQKAFRIPFQIPDPAEQKQLQEVQLYVARNGGRWEKYTAAAPDLPPEKRSFTFRADQDGEYWFAVRTLDRRGVQNPEDDASLQAGLRVVVDSEVPKIELRPITRPGREVGVEWEVQDRNLELDSLKLEYRVEGQETWQLVPGAVPKFIGQTTWVPDAPGRVSVRCQVQDRAQNLGIASVELEPSSTTGRSPASSTERLPTAPGTARERTNWPSETPTTRSGNLPTYSGPGTKRDLGSDGVRREQTAASFSTDIAVDSAVDTNRAKGSNGASYPTRSPGGTSGATKPVNRQIVRDPDVSLDYQIEGEGPSGISVVELWLTSDMGRTWELFSEDRTRRSPLVAKLPGDGLYGLTLVAKSGVGLGDRPPTAGDQPQTWVEVDTTAPQVRLLSADPGKGDELGSLVIAWKADDENLGDRCVTLLYFDGSRLDKGEWKTIDSGIENTGRYVWKLGSQVPFKFRIAIEVADQAGNLQRVESSEITIDTSKPRSRISGVNSAGSYRR